MNPETETPTPHEDASPVTPPTKSWLARNWWILLIFVLAAGGAIVFAATRSNNTRSTGNNPDGQRSSQESSNREMPKGEQAPDLGDGYSSDPIEKGKALSNGKCEGTGSKPLTSAPMHPSDLSVIIPYGLMAGGHVTPIDHQYYWGKVQMGNPDMYEVLAPADGTIVDIGFRDHSQQPNAKVKGDYRVVISYSCTFLSYFDLATSLSADIQAKLPTGWETSKGIVNDIAIPVKAGQVLGKVGGQSLDFAVWDTEKPLKNLLVPTAYNNAEPWKIVSVPPLNYYTTEVKNQILPFYARVAEPRDGVIDQDVEGTAMGNWFKEGSNGYAGTGGNTTGSYWVGHLSFAKDHVDPNGGYVFSTGDWKGQATQFSIINPSVAPEKITTASGAVKYEIGQWQHTLNGKQWIGEGPGAIKFAAGSSQGTVLVQLMENHKLKVETFPGKSAAQVTGFTAAAVMYNRGDDAVQK